MSETFESVCPCDRQPQRALTQCPPRRVTRAATRAAPRVAPAGGAGAVGKGEEEAPYLTRWVPRRMSWGCSHGRQADGNGDAPVTHRLRPDVLDARRSDVCAFYCRPSRVFEHDRLCSQGPARLCHRAGRPLSRLFDRAGLVSRTVGRGAGTEASRISPRGPSRLIPSPSSHRGPRSMLGSHRGPRSMFRMIRMSYRIPSVSASHLGAVAGWTVAVVGERLSERAWQRGGRKGRLARAAP